MQDMISILKNSIFISKKGCVHVCISILENYLINSIILIIKAEKLRIQFLEIKWLPKVIQVGSDRDEIQICLSG